MNAENRQLNVFFLEDNVDDVDLELYELRRAGFQVRFEMARNRKEFTDKLPAATPDIILADYSLPDITGVEAIDICRTMHIDVPIILITGEGNEQIAVDSLRLGAIDYIIKRNISGLPARVSRALEIWSDRRAKVRAEAEERKLQQLLFDAQKMEAIGRFAGGIAHDFNNILTGVIGYTEMCMRHAENNPAIQNNLQSVISFSQRGADLIKQLLIFSRKVPMELEQVELNSFLAENILFLNRIVEKSIAIHSHPFHENLHVQCDKRQFQQVLMNLILNARDAMNGRGVLTIKTDKRRRTNDTAHTPATGTGREYACLSVSDTGSGINEHHKQKIFDPFFTTKEAGKGTGLGLSIVYSVVNAHKGTIEVASRKEGGTTFTIFLPLSDATERVPTADPPTEEMRPHAIKQQGNETILLAEDEDVIRGLTVSMLKSLGYTVIPARDGAEALDIYRSGNYEIDLVLSDMIMPRKSGIELFTELHAINPELKFILVTGYSPSEQDQNVLDSMDAILSKPYTTSEITQLIREILDKNMA